MPLVANSQTVATSTLRRRPRRTSPLVVVGGLWVPGVCHGYLAAPLEAPRCNGLRKGGYVALDNAAAVRYLMNRGRGAMRLLGEVALNLLVAIVGFAIVIGAWALLLAATLWLRQAL